MQLIEVAFKGNRKEFFHWPHDEAPPLQAAVIVDADRGEDLGVVRATGELAQQRFAGVAHGEKAGPVTKTAQRLATAEERERARELRAVADEDARRRGMERVRAHGLLMKLSDAEWQWDRKQLTFYFTAEKRVDFRALVRDLAAAFRTRIELRQIGVRDEAKRLDGVGRCGRQYCSASWLPELRPVNLGVAKDQHLSLNPLQISGACGRLMCCLRYEHEFYVQSRKRFPKEGKILVTAVGEEKVLANDIFGDRVTLRNVEGDVRVVPLAELKREMAERGADDRDGAAGAGEAAGTAGGDRVVAPRPRRALPVRDESRMPPSRAARPPRPRPDAPLERITTVAEPTLAGREEGAQAAVIPLDSPEAAMADEQRQRAERGELPADGDVSATGDDRRRRRRGRRGGRRGRGSGGGGGGHHDTDTNAGDASGPADQGE
ncbi:MAG TPA: regulatory iron-sulfur-containing complex subunit RicT [Gemmatimonadaceae bacterium]